MKITLIEGFDAYVLGPWVVLPVTEGNPPRPILNVCKLVGLGVQLTIRESARSLAQRMAHELKAAEVEKLITGT